MISIQSPSSSFATAGLAMLVVLQVNARSISSPNLVSDGDRLRSAVSLCPSQQSLAYLGQGYNNFLANPVPTGVWTGDQGWQNQVFATQSKDDSPIAVFICEPVSSSSMVQSSKAIESSSQWTSDQTSSFSMSGGVPEAGSASASTSSSLAASQMVNQQSVFYVEQYSQTQFNAKIQPATGGSTIQLSTGFIAAVNRLPVSDYVGDAQKHESYLNLLNAFGTSFVSSIEFGGSWVETYEFNSQSYGIATSDASAFQLGMSATDDDVQASGNASSAQDNNNNNSMSGYISSTTLNTVGGTPGNFNSWQTSLNNNEDLYPLQFDLTPFRSLPLFLGESSVNFNFCPTTNNCFSEIQTKLNAFGKYLKENACTGNTNAIYQTCTTTPDSKIPPPYVAPEVASPVPAPTNSKRSMSIRFQTDYYIAASYCYVSSINIQHGNLYSDNNCLPGYRFGAKGCSLDCYFAMESNGHGIYGDAGIECVYLNGNTNGFTFSWALPEDFPYPIEVLPTPSSSLAATTDGACETHCNIIGTITMES
eukprot:Awhi_evm1s655